MAHPNAALEQLLGAIPNAQTTEDALFRRAQIDIDDASAKQLLGTRENVAGRGLGIGKYLADLEAGVAGEKAKALEKARLDAFTASQQARLAALGSAAGHLNQQSAIENASYQAGKNRKVAKSGQWLQAGTGIGAAGLGTAGRVFGDEIKGGLKDLFGNVSSGVRGASDSLSDFLRSSSGPGEQIVEGMPDLSAGFGQAGFGVGESDFDFGGTDIPSFQMPDFSSDFSGLQGLGDGLDIDFLRSLESLL